MPALIEPLESRRLMSVRPEGVVTANPPVDTAPLLVNGVLAVDGTAGDDNVTVRVYPAKNARAAQVAVRVVSGTTVDGKLTGTATRNVLVPADQVERVVVTGNGGQDQLVTDVTAYKITKSVDVDTRAVTGVNKKGRTVYNEDAMSTGMIGVYGGSTAKWKKRSYGDIMRSHKAAYASEVLFLGNSHVNYLTQTGASAFKDKLGTVPNVNLGLPGDTTSQLLYRIQQQNMLAGTAQVKAVVLEIGTNNVALSDDVDAIARGIRSVVVEVRQRMPGARILVNSILPRRTNAENKVINKVNERLHIWKRGSRITFIDVTSEFTGKAAQAKYYRPNDIHLNSNGYRVWVDRLTPAVDLLLGGNVL